jgi:hypothetical protein
MTDYIASESFARRHAAFEGADDQRPQPFAPAFAGLV